MNISMGRNYEVERSFYYFVTNEILPLTGLNQEDFWKSLEQLLCDFKPINTELLYKRDCLQNKINEWHKKNPQLNLNDYQTFLEKIGYLKPECDDFVIETKQVDEEISSIAAPQLVVPADNERFVLNAVNARWGSLYSAIYGTDAFIELDSQQSQSDTDRESEVVKHAKMFLDRTFPLSEQSHLNACQYKCIDNQLIVEFEDQKTSHLVNADQFVAFEKNERDELTTLVLKNNGLHVAIYFDAESKVGKKDKANISDIQLESALTTIVDFEDSVSAVDAEDKIKVYRNWLGLMLGNLSANFVKNGKLINRQANTNKILQSVTGSPYELSSRSLLMARNVGLLMSTEIITDKLGNPVPEGILDAVMTALIGMLDLNRQENTHQNSKSGSIYIVKPKLHGADEVAFTCDLFSRVEKMLGIKRNTIKLGIMDEERRTSLNLKNCIFNARERLAFINTGFLDRTGDEIHTSMEAGAFFQKNQTKQKSWYLAYENRNVEIGLACGLSGKAQIGKGMWAMTDEMHKMVQEKIKQLQAGASTAWVPSPTAATLHAMHYHEIDVFKVQQKIKDRKLTERQDLLKIPVMSQPKSLTQTEILHELENNVQGILGYVVRWTQMGIGCSKVPDINNIGTMEDRATLRISSQHISNWLHHGICDKKQVLSVMHKMAEIVDSQNHGQNGYRPMLPDARRSIAFQAALKLIFEGRDQANGYTEPTLHEYRSLSKKLNHCYQAITEIDDEMVTSEKIMCVNEA